MWPFRGPAIEEARTYMGDVPTFFGLSLRQFSFYKRDYFWAFISLIVTHWTQAKLPFLAKELSEKLSLMSMHDAWIFVGVALATLFFRTSSRLLFFFPARAMERDLRLEMMTAVENSPPGRYKKFSPGQLFQVISNDVEQVRAYIGFALLQLANLGVALVILLPKLAAFEPKLLWALLPLFFSFLLFLLLIGTTRVFQRKAVELQGDLQNFILESYNAKKTIKHFQSEIPFSNMFQKISKLELQNFYYSAMGAALATPLLPFGMGVSLCWGAYIIFDLNLGASSLVLFSGITFLLMEPLAFISWIGIVWAQSIASYKRIVELKNLTLTKGEDELRLESLNPEKKKDSYTVDWWGKALTLKLKTGKTYAILGPTGVGKSTALFQLALGLKNSGVNTAYVAQTPYLYNDTLKINLFLGRTPNEKEEAEAYEFLKLVGLDFLASDRQELFAMVVGEHGKKLSGGQGKRLALVRSIISGADVIIWDDPFAAVDIILERQIFEKFEKLGVFRNKIVVMATHRLTSAKFCHEYVLLNKEDGAIERGEIELLEHKKSLGHEFFEKQLVTAL